VVADGDFTMLLADHPTVYAFTRRLEDVELLVLANFSSGAVDVQLSDDLDGDAIAAWSASEVVLRSGVRSSSGLPFALGPWEARVHRRVVAATA